MTLKICVVIPAHNEEHSIGPLVEKLKTQGYDVIVIDDGSTDQSGSIAQERGADVIRHAQRMGKGRSLREGFGIAMTRHYDAVVAMDGDGQHAPEDIKHFIEKAVAKGPCVVVGNRMSNPRGMPWLRRITNRGMSKIIAAVCRQAIPDSQCGFRLMTRDVLQKIELSCNDFEIETEVLVEAAKKGFKIYSVPIQTIYCDELSHINPVSDTIRFFRYLIKILCSRKP